MGIPPFTPSYMLLSVRVGLRPGICTWSASLLYPISDTAQFGSAWWEPVQASGRDPTAPRILLLYGWLQPCIWMFIRPRPHQPKVRAGSEVAVSCRGVWERQTHVILTEALADVWVQEAFPQPSWQVACDARNITAGVLARSPGSTDDMLVFQTLVMSP